MFFKRKGYELTLHRVHDTVRIREGDESITLTVEADPMRMVAALSDAQKVLKSVAESTDVEAQRQAALTFAGAIFGDSQAAKLLDFYHDDPACVINVCGRYFGQRLSKKIAQAQKKA